MESMSGNEQGKTLKKLLPQLREKIGYRKAMLELQTAGLSETTARQLLMRTYDSVPRQIRIVEAIEDVLAKHGINKAS